MFLVTFDVLVNLVWYYDKAHSQSSNPADVFGPVMASENMLAEENHEYVLDHFVL